jgi:hypothetical protein
MAYEPASEGQEEEKGEPATGVDSKVLQNTKTLQ